MNIDEVAARFDGTRRNGDGYTVRCPCGSNHNNGDAKPSLQVWTDDNGNTAVCCMSQQCPQDDILAAVGLDWRDLKADGPNGRSTSRTKPAKSNDKPKDERKFYDSAKHVATYTYTDADGKYLCEKRRDSDKEFAWFHGDKSGKDGHDVIYRLSHVVASDQGDTVYLCEGEKDADRLASIGYDAATSLMTTGAWRDGYAEQFRHRDVISLMDNDAAGGKAAAKLLPGLLPIARTVRVVSFADCEDEPTGYDVSDYLDEHGPDKLATRMDATPVVKDTPAPKADAVGDEKNTTSVADRLVNMALESYRFGRTDKNEAFAVAADGPNLAVMLRGSGDALRSQLARQYRADNGKTPNASALADALTVLAGEALEAAPEQVFLRVASYGDDVVIDLAEIDGRAVIVRPGSWEVVDRSPVLFKRTALTSALPIPERGGSLDELRELLNVSDDTWPLIVAWLVAALIPNIPHPILLLSGLQGTGKSSAARALVNLFDPSPAPLRSEPRDVNQWQVAAAGSWGVVLDNISRIAPWLADALCRASTGDGLVKRKLYSDGDLAVLAFRAMVCLTSIDPGALRGDLGERLLLADLEPIGETSRRTEQQINAEYEERHARLFGSLLDSVAAVMDKLPDVQPKRMPRMADFGRVLMAADRAGVTDGAFDRFLEQQPRIALEVLDGDVFATEVLKFAQHQGEWAGTAGELLAAMRPDDTKKAPKGWPKPCSATGQLKRLTPALSAAGVAVQIPPRRTRHGRIITLTAVEGAVEYSRGTQSQPSHLSPGPPMDKDLPLECDSSDGRDSHSQELLSTPEGNGQTKRAPANDDAKGARF